MNEEVLIEEEELRSFKEEEDQDCKQEQQVLNQELKRRVEHE
jgi:hypothetical protein